MSTTRWQPNPDEAAHELATRVARFRLGWAKGLIDGNDEPNSREHAFANEFVNDLIDAGWTPPQEETPWPNPPSPAASAPPPKNAAASTTAPAPTSSNANATPTNSTSAPAPSPSSAPTTPPTPTYAPPSPTPEQPCNPTIGSSSSPAKRSSTPSPTSTTRHPTSEPYRLLVTGTREPLTLQQNHFVITTITTRAPGRDIVLVHGDCPTGIDKICADIANNPTWPNITAEPHPANWAEYGTIAGPIRNTTMVKPGADECLAFPGPTSRGTWDCYRKARAAGIPSRVFPLGTTP